MKKIGRNDPCWCGSGKKYKVCHEAMDEKILVFKEKGCIVPTHDLIKTPEQNCRYPRKRKSQCRCIRCCSV